MRRNPAELLKCVRQGSFDVRNRTGTLSCWHNETNSQLPLRAVTSRKLANSNSKVGYWPDDGQYRSYSELEVGL